MALRLLLVSDTQVPVRACKLPDQVWSAVENADVVFHAGDWVSAVLLDEFQRRLRLLNPGSPTDRRRQPVCTYMTADVAEGSLRDVRLVELGSQLHFSR